MIRTIKIQFFSPGDHCHKRELFLFSQEAPFNTSRTADQKGAPAMTGSNHPIRYKVRHNNGVLWEPSDECVLGISVGQPGHEEKKFSATIEWASKRFSRIHVVVFDTLQRYNLMNDVSYEIELARQHSREAGDQWLSRNLPALNSATVPLTISRWDDWINDLRFANFHQQIISLYNSYADLKAVVDEDARKYLSRASRVGKLSQNMDRAMNNSTALILEECAAFCVIWTDHPGVDIYPGSELTTSRCLKAGQGFEPPSIMINRRFARILFLRREDTSN